MKPADVRAFAKVAREAGLSELSVETPDGLKLRLVVGEGPSLKASPRRGRAKQEEPPRAMRQRPPDEIEIADDDAKFLAWQQGKGVQ